MVLRVAVVLGVEDMVSGVPRLVAIFPLICGPSCYLVYHLRILRACLFFSLSLKMRMLDVSEVAKIGKKPSLDEVCHIILTTTQG